MKIKELKETHPAIYKRILECQVEQGNVANDELDLVAEKSEGGFDWPETIEQWEFWNDVYDTRFQIFYDKYPQQEKKVPTYVVNGETYHYGEEVEVSDEGNEWCRRLLVFTDQVHILAVEGIDSENFLQGKMYCTTTWKYVRKAPQITKLTKQQIADKFELDVNLIEII